MSFHYHTSRVVLLRWLFPVLGVLTLIAAVSWPAIREFQAERLSLKNGAGLRVQGVSMRLPKGGGPAHLQVSHPEFTGRDEQGRPYVVTALRVVQEGLQPGASAMNLERPTAKLLLDKTSGETVALTADKGFFDPKVQTLQLDGAVKLTHSNGYAMDLEDLFVDLQQGVSFSKNPVSGAGPAGTLRGETLELRDKGNHIILHGRSKLVLTPQKDG